MKPRIVVTQGDLGGIGPEVLLHCLSDRSMSGSYAPLILGHIDFLRQLAIRDSINVKLQAVKSAADGFSIAQRDTSILPVLELKSGQPSATIGKPHAEFGKAAVEAVVTATRLCLDKTAHAMLTPPINKESMHLAGFDYEGQTQIIGQTAGSSSHGMLACAGNLRVLIATRHMSLRKALDTLTIDYLVEQIKLAHVTAREVLGIDSPRIALAGLNPHAGEGGAFGDEESKILQPAIEQASQRFGFSTIGPLVPDVVFNEGAQGKYDLVIALYHDQAFIALKMLPREKANSLFVGADVLRLSPMHGSAYDIVGKQKADARPLLYCLQQAVRLAQNRQAAARV
ncbi:MAG: 4-hydroxythreonine-4-phosphate dehydrogenase PdxA [Planctomycetes bacterium]|nr:4-hydroxythreonine-4-phosphate dehydrogenase PdxA [Planctomycetota bacterium]